MVTFNWKRDGNQSIGFIAQHVEAALPTDGKFNDILNSSVYQPTEEDEPLVIKTLDYSRMACVLWAACKQQAAKLTELEARISALEGNPV